MADPILDNAQLTIHEKSPIRGLLKRLADGTLRPKERDALTRVQAILAAEQRGISMPQIAETLGLKLTTLRAFTMTDQYRVKIGRAHV